MCRLFGFRSVIPSQVHRSLLAADNALGVQSNAHPDGWGVAHYVDGAPHVTRAPSTAMNDAIFQRLSGIVASETLLAHVRKATVGPKTVLNCHPFQYGKWVFAHNGEVRRFESKRGDLLAEVAPRLRRYILGDTDSEVLFFILLTELSAHGQLSSRLGVDELSAAIRTTVKKVRAHCDTPEDPSLLTFIITDGVSMAATQGGKELFFSTHKSRCADRDTCPHLAPECESATATGHVNHLVFSSEVIRGDNVWTELGAGDIVAIDWRMRLTRAHVERRTLPVD
ncbi:MAG: class II glutamine amidotransferase [Deltaproteobacteria bacterium]|nr:class II glutamine amidotransferase [Deltaproteobacteria bacterium]